MMVNPRRMKLAVARPVSCANQEIEVAQRHQHIRADCAAVNRIHHLVPGEQAQKGDCSLG